MNHKVQFCEKPCGQASARAGLTYRRMTFVVLFVGMFLVRSEAAGQQIVSADGGRVSVAAQEIPLQKLLDRFAELGNLSLWVQPGVGERVVTIDVDPLPIADALRRVLISADVDFVMSGGGANEPIRLVIGDSNAPEAAMTGTAESPIVEPLGQPETTFVTEEPEEEREEDRATPAQPTAMGTQGGAAMSGTSPAERLVQLLAPTGQAKPAPGTPIALPFLGPDGKPYTVQYNPPPPGFARLPFPDANGEPLLQVIVQTSPPGQIALPFLGPDGQPYTVPAPPAPISKPPGGGR